MDSWIDYLTGGPKLTSCGTQPLPAHTGVSSAMFQQSFLQLQLEKRNMSVGNTVSSHLWCSSYYCCIKINPEIWQFKMTSVFCSPFYESGICKLFTGQSLLGVSHEITVSCWLLLLSSEGSTGLHGLDGAFIGLTVEADCCLELSCSVLSKYPHVVCQHGVLRTVVYGISGM